MLTLSEKVKLSTLATPVPVLLMRTPMKPFLVTVEPIIMPSVKKVIGGSNTRESSAVEVAVHVIEMSPWQSHLTGV